ncbi:hypothetical protein MH117_24585 [Paenibacillus sp. ACRRX]|uniref:phage tail terminator family protein n=1 Tax=Paenibacillus sp. ACRRX TaxID=2918206 RepID=UPI001EF62938|nr:hypothetical protein [Paenibacillus sp. ACRRX]MCG7410578.1 hypothetical protein [Paenibacillus sp. ACRRX]
MLSLKDIAIAINKKLKTVFPDIVINSTDISEGFARPSFFVDFNSSKRQQQSTRRIDRSISCIIYFFPTDRYQHKIEMLEVQEKLEDAFMDELVLNDNVRLYMGELSASKTDGVLQLSFDIVYTEIGSSDSDDAALEYMEELHYKG